MNEKGDRVPEFKLKNQNWNGFDLGTVLGKENLSSIFIRITILQDAQKNLTSSTISTMILFPPGRK